MRLLLLSLALSLPAQAGAWEFTPVPVCTLRHEDPDALVEVTFDPRLPEPYAITITRSESWADSPVFSIRYEGARSLTISTSRHVLSDGGRTLTVTDRGFGNVLDGLEFNATATASLGDLEITFPLDDAADPVRAFRDCESAAVA